MYRLSVNSGVEWTHVILIPVNVQLWFCPIGRRGLVRKYLELLGRDGCVKVLYRIAYAEFLRGIAIGTRAVFGREVIKIRRIANFGVVNIKAPYLIHYPGMLPVE